jgi:hypothetical protein
MKKKPTSARPRKSYENPTLMKLTPEQAKLKLLGAANMGDQGAKELLEKMFPDEPSEKLQEQGRNSVS